MPATARKRMTTNGVEYSSEGPSVVFHNSTKEQTERRGGDGGGCYLPPRKMERPRWFRWCRLQCASRSEATTLQMKRYGSRCTPLRKGRRLRRLRWCLPQCASRSEATTLQTERPALP